jgi:hypothetical protein
MKERQRDAENRQAGSPDKLHCRIDLMIHDDCTDEGYPRQNREESCHDVLSVDQASRGKRMCASATVRGCWQGRTICDNGRT